MKKVAGILGIIGGGAGLITSMITVYVLGVREAMGGVPKEPDAIIFRPGWEGLFFSILAIICSFIMIKSDKKWPSFTLLLCSILGFIKSDPLVSMAMILCFISALLGLLRKSTKQR